MLDGLWRTVALEWFPLSRSVAERPKKIEREWWTEAKEKREDDGSGIRTHARED